MSWLDLCAKCLDAMRAGEDTHEGKHYLVTPNPSLTDEERRAAYDKHIRPIVDILGDDEIEGKEQWI